MTDSFLTKWERVIKTVPAPVSRPNESWSKELVRAIAMDIGKAAVHHLETMYPAAIAACPATMKLSLRNCIHNEIMAALETNDAAEIAERLRRRKEHRRKIKAAYTKIRKSPSR